jgi:hypothetical protein
MKTIPLVLCELPSYVSYSTANYDGNYRITYRVILCNLWSLECSAKERRAGDRCILKVAGLLPKNDLTHCQLRILRVFLHEKLLTIMPIQQGSLAATDKTLRFVPNGSTTARTAQFRMYSLTDKPPSISTRAGALQLLSFVYLNTLFFPISTPTPLDTTGPLFMKLTTTFAFALVAFAGATSQDPENLDTVDHPDYMATIDLDEVESETLSGQELFPRKQVQACEAAVFGSRPVWESVKRKDNFAETIASLIKSRSDHKNCGIITGVVDEISFSYSATGKGCDTTAQRDTIQGALKQALRLPGKDSIYPTMCFRLSHGAGSWNGFLSVGPTKLYNTASKCDGRLRFDTCAS